MSWSDPAYEAVADLLVRRTGLLFGPPRRLGAEAGIRRAMGRARVADPTRYLDLLNADAAALDDLVVELTVGETYFFRETGQFDFLRRVVLPELARRGGPAPGVRAWSAGCASGEEAYSLAIVLTEEGAEARTHLLATDISRASLVKARRAVFGVWSLRGEGAAAARSYLLPRAEKDEGGRGGFVLDDRIRRRVHFEYLNLALDHYPSLATDIWGMNIIFCRNVLIYFNAETIEAVARRLYETLAPGGWLFTAASDPPLAPHARFETVTTDAGVLYRRNAGSMHCFFPLPTLERQGEEGTWGQGEEGARRGDKGTRGQGASRTSSPGTQGQDWGRNPRSFPLFPLSPCPLVPSSPCPLLSSGERRRSRPARRARQALAEGDYDHAAELTRGRPDDAAACTLHVRSLANLDVGRAERACVEAMGRHPLSAELHFLHGVLLVGLGLDGDAAR